MIHIPIVWATREKSLFMNDPMQGSNLVVSDVSSQSKFSEVYLKYIEERIWFPLMKETVMILFNDYCNDFI